MKYNSVYYELETRGLEQDIKSLAQLRTELIGKGFNPPWSVTRGWEYAKLIRATNPMSGEKALDIGSANSILPFYLKELGVTVYACDIIKPKPVEADYYRQAGIEYKIADIMTLPYADRTFDLVYSICVLEHIYPFCNDDDIVRETVRALREVARILKSGGLTAHTCDFYVPGFNTYRTYHNDLLVEILRRVGDVLVPVDEPDYKILDAADYYVNNNTIYADPGERERRHLSFLREGKKPENLFTCASVVLRKL